MAMHPEKKAKVVTTPRQSVAKIIGIKLTDSRMFIVESNDMQRTPPSPILLSMSGDQHESIVQ